MAALNIIGTNFVTNGVRIGDEVKITLPVGQTYYVTTNGTTHYTGKFYITNILGETQVEFDGFVNGVAQGLILANLNPAINTTGNITIYDIVHTYTKDEQVDLLVATAQSYADKRVVLVWPGDVVWEDEDGNDVDMDGSTLAAAFAAAVSAYPAQQSFTNLRFTGPKELKYSNKYFTPTQLNKLSNAGLMVFVQDVTGGSIYARHQKTTSTASIQEQEFSVTKAVDKVSLDIYDTVKPFIGKYNITPDLLTQLEENISKYLFNAKNVKAPYCGGLIISYSNLSLRANLLGQNLDLNPGTVAISLTIEVGYPFNYADITIFVQ